MEWSLPMLLMINLILEKFWSKQVTHFSQVSKLYQLCQWSLHPFHLFKSRLRWEEWWLRGPAPAVGQHRQYVVVDKISTTGAACRSVAHHTDRSIGDEGNIDRFMLGFFKFEVAYHKALLKTLRRVFRRAIQRIYNRTSGKNCWVKWIKAKLLS